VSKNFISGVDSTESYDFSLDFVLLKSSSSCNLCLLSFSFNSVIDACAKCQLIPNLVAE